MLFDTKEPPIVISIGGSLIVPKEGIDPKFLSHLNSSIRQFVKQGKRFFLVAGGGRLARIYRDAGRAVIGGMSEDDLDWLGIHATRLNAHLLRTIFADLAHPRIIENYDKALKDWKEPVVIGAGWKPGWSTDYDAVMLAKDYGANLIINLSNIYYVYDKDPNKYKDAKAIKRLTWEELEKLVGTEWSPGINAPFDPIAAQLAKKLNLTVIVTHGEDFKNLSNILEGDTFKGTVIMPYRIDASFYDREYYTGNKTGYKLVSNESFLAKVFQYAANYYRAILIRLLINPKNCLDVGCGTGQLVRMLRRFGIDAYGVEISDYALESADKSVKPYLKKGDIMKLPYNDDSFDLVCSFDVMEHVERSKIKKAINETIRVSKKHILHKIYTRENVWMRMFHSADRSHISIFSKKFWQRLFLENDKVTLLRNSFFKLPSFMESVFFLKKK